MLSSLFSQKVSDVVWHRVKQASRGRTARLPRKKPLPNGSGFQKYLNQCGLVVFDRNQAPKKRGLTTRRILAGVEFVRDLMVNEVGVVGADGWFCTFLYKPRTFVSPGVICALPPSQPVNTSAAAARERRVRVLQRMFILGFIVKKIQTAKPRGTWQEVFHGDAKDCYSSSSSTPSARSRLEWTALTSSRASKISIKCSTLRAVSLSLIGTVMLGK